jgi:hypothetical protein
MKDKIHQEKLLHHIVRRLKERYDIDSTVEEVRQLNKYVVAHRRDFKDDKVKANHPQKLLLEIENLSMYLHVPFKDREVIFVYGYGKKSLCTVVTKEEYDNMIEVISQYETINDFINDSYGQGRLPINIHPH